MRVGPTDGRGRTADGGAPRAAEGLLRENAAPSEAEIRRGMAANICRCTGYVKIIESVQSATAERAGKEVSA